MLSLARQLVFFPTTLTLCTSCTDARRRSEKGQKIVQLDVALAMWDLLAPALAWPHMAAWQDFLRTHHKRAVSRDTWNQLYEFQQVRAEKGAGRSGRLAWSLGHADRAWRDGGGRVVALKRAGRTAGRAPLGAMPPTSPRPPATTHPCPAQSVGTDFSNYDENAAWPYLIDDWVSEMRKQQANGGA